MASALAVLASEVLALVLLSQPVVGLAKPNIVRR
jgi:hypothetical protein